MFSRIFKLFTLLSMIVLVQAAPAPTTTSPPAPTTTDCEPSVTTGPAVRAVTPNTPVTGLELGSAGGVAVLKTLGWHGIWAYGGGAISKIEWTAGCFAVKYLIIETTSNSFKSLTWNNANLTSTWKSPYETDIGTLSTCTSQAYTDFLACQRSTGVWTLYLQTGNDAPAGVTCATTKLRITPS